MCPGSAGARQAILSRKVSRLAFAGLCVLFRKWRMPDMVRWRAFSHLQSIFHPMKFRRDGDLYLLSISFISRYLSGNIFKKSIQRNCAMRCALPFNPVCCHMIWWLLLFLKCYSYCFFVFSCDFGDAYDQSYDVTDVPQVPRNTIFYFFYPILLWSFFLLNRLH